MQLITKKINAILIIRLEGRLDVHYSSPLEKEINSLIEKNPECNILFNFEQVEYMSSTAIRIFIHTQKLLTTNGRSLALCCLNNIVSEVFKITGLSTAFNIYLSEDSALNPHN